MLKYNKILFPFLLSGTTMAGAEVVDSLKISWAEWGPADSLQEVCDLYYNETGIKVTVDQEPWATWQTAFFDNMKDGNPKQFDMVVGDSQWLGLSTSSGLYVELTDFIKDNSLDTLVPPATIKYYSEYDDKLWAYPTEGDAIGWAYRKDLFEDPAEKEKYFAQYGRELAPPNTLSELKDIANFFTRPDEELYGVGMYVSSDYDAITMGFETAMFSYGGDWQHLTQEAEKKDLSPSIDALQFYKDLYDCCQSESSVDLDYVHIETIFFSGKTAMVMHYFAMMDPFDSAANPYLNSTGYFVNPAGPTGKRGTSLGGQGLSILSADSPERQQASKDFLLWFASENTQIKYAEAGGLSCNTNVAESEEFLSSKPFHSAYAESLPITKDFWNVPSYEALLNVSQTELNKFIVKGVGTAEETINLIATQQDLILLEADSTLETEQKSGETYWATTSTMSALSTIFIAYTMLVSM